jgi:hypothetical protein
MSELRPYTRDYEAPLSPGARFIRGFKRIGLAIGIGSFVVGMAISVGIGIQQINDKHGRYTQAQCVADLQRRNIPLAMGEYDKLKVSPDRSGCPGPMYLEIIPVILETAKNKPAPLEGFFEPTYIGFLISAAVGTMLFAAFWLVGWICAGFTRD